MKRVLIYAIEGCSACREVANHVEDLLEGTNIELTKRFCGDQDEECDEIEDKLDTGKYPIVFTFGFAYHKEKFNKDSGIVYICSTADKLHTPVKFNKSTIAEGVLDVEAIKNKLNQIIK